MHKPALIVIFTIILLSTAATGLAADRPSPVVLQIEAKRVSASGITPGGSAIILGVGLVRHQYWSSIVRRQYFVTDTDSDGVVAAATRDTDGIIWCAVDVISGRYSISATDPSIVHAIDLSRGLRRNATVGIDAVEAGHDFLEYLWVRPGVGAWGQSAGDGGANDADGAVNGRIIFQPGKASSIGSSPPPQSSVLPHDIIVVIDPFKREIFATEVPE